MSQELITQMAESDCDMDSEVELQTPHTDILHQNFLKQLEKNYEQNKNGNVNLLKKVEKMDYLSFASAKCDSSIQELTELLPEVYHPKKKKKL